eukprot:50515-Eustigmatos_ZCMA.PRE.1
MRKAIRVSIEGIYNGPAAECCGQCCHAVVQISRAFSDTIACVSPSQREKRRVQTKTAWSKSVPSLRGGA